MNTFIRETSLIYKVSFTDGTILETTWNHPFRVLKTDARDQDFTIENTEWKQAKDLYSGDIALSANGETLKITSIEIDERIETVYNFEVEQFHTYFVGESGIWVHNEGYKESAAALEHGYNKEQRDNQTWYEKIGDGAKGVISAIDSLFSTAVATFEANRVSTQADTHGGVNAVRHAYWQARMTSLSDANLAIMVGDAHETDIQLTELADSEVDQFNNKVGRQIGSRMKGASREEIERAVLNAYNNGELRVLQPSKEYEKTILDLNKLAYGGKTITKDQFENEVYTNIVGSFYKSPPPGNYKIVPSRSPESREMTREEIIKRTGIKLIEKK